MAECPYGDPFCPCQDGVSYQLINRATGEVVCTVIDMQEGRYWDDCPICGKHRRLDHAVGWYCGPTHDEIGAISTEYRSGTDEPAIVGGRCVCKGCHDVFYADGPLAPEGK